MERSFVPNSYLRQSPLAHLHLDVRAAADFERTSNTVLIGELRFQDMLNLRGSAKDPAFKLAVEKTVGCSLPKKLNTTSMRGSDITILALATDEWLIVTKSGKGAEPEKRLRNKLQDQHASVTSVGEARTVIRLAGNNARNLLAKGCPLDLHPSAFGPGVCAQTLLARTGMLLHCLPSNSSKADLFDIYIARSFAEYAWSWIEDAGQEYGTAVVIPQKNVHKTASMK